MKIFLSIIVILFIIWFCICFFALITISKYKINKDLLKQNEHVITILDENDNEYIKEENSNEYTPFNEIPENLINAFVSIEDKRFYKHNGVDIKGLARAIIRNITSFSYKQGGSTITQQLVKNTHLSSEKSIKRKLIEIKLSLDLEKQFSKSEIMEMYLNTIYFGQNCYGISEASSVYFNKKPRNLSLNECASLAGIVKAPSSYSPTKNIEKFNKRKNVILNEMYSQGYIDKNELENSLKENLSCEINSTKNYDYIYLVENELKNNSFCSSNKNIKTNLNIDIQNKINSELNKISNDVYKTILVYNKNGICAYASNVGICNRQLGSAIKPLAVYSPALEKNYIYPCTPILDEKTNINGYSPSNFNNKYYGYISCKTALSKSLNTVAVKILNSLGLDYSFDVLNKMNFKLNNEDKNLSLALGATKNGQNILTLASAYSIYMNNGLYSELKTIKNSKINKEIFSTSTIALSNIMMKDTVENGTLKKLKGLNIPLYGKTGTCGNKKGNSDAYSISFNNSYGVICWTGNKNEYLSNEYTGGGVATTTAYNVWQFLKENYELQDFNENHGIVKLYIDKDEYNLNHNVVLADENAPNNEKLYEYFSVNNAPRNISNKYTCPKIKNVEITINNNEINIQLCQTQHYNYIIKKYKNDIFVKKYDIKKESFIDIEKNGIIQYEIIPYYQGKDKKYYGESYFTKKIKLSDKISDSNFWDE